MATRRTQSGHAFPVPDQSVYIDFEGTADHEPTLLGILWPESPRLPRFQQIVFEDSFFTLAESSRCPAGSLEAAITDLVRTAEEHDLQIVAWSTHELDVVQKWAPGLTARFDARHSDAKRFAKKWLSRERPGFKPPLISGRGRHTLDFYLKELGYAVPTSHGPNLTGKRIRQLRDELARKNFEAARLTSTSKRKWTNLLKHNYHDCAGMRHVMKTIQASGALQRSGSVLHSATT